MRMVLKQNGQKDIKDIDLTAVIWHTTFKFQFMIKKYKINNFNLWLKSIK